MSVPDNTSADCCPTLVLLLRAARTVTLGELTRIVREELDDDAASTVAWVGENAFGGSYWQWRNRTTPYHLGTFDQPYIHLAGEGKVGGPIRWQMREGVPPNEPSHCEAWMDHNAWLYVDALNMGATRDKRDHRSLVFRIATRLVDDRCVLLWLRGGDDKRVTLPTPHAIASLRNGVWPG